MTTYAKVRKSQFGHYQYYLETRNIKADKPIEKPNPIEPWFDTRGQATAFAKKNGMVPVDTWAEACMLEDVYRDGNNGIWRGKYKSKLPQTEAEHRANIEADMGHIPDSEWNEIWANHTAKQNTA